MKKLKKIVSSEAWEQEKLFEWAKDNIKNHYELWLLNASMNGFIPNKNLRFKAVKQGLKAGFPDINLPIARQGFHALYIEMKRVDVCAIDKYQIPWHKLLRDEGNRVAVCSGWHEAKNVLINYLTEIA